MSCELISSQTLKARKAHTCTWCGEVIEPGTTYVCDRVVVEGEPSTNKLHPECDRALDEAAALEGGFVLFTPGEQPRGAIDRDNLEGPP